MDRLSDSPTKQLYGSVTVPGKNKFLGTHRIVWITLWVVGIILFGVAAVIVHSHTAPWSVELAFTKYIQGPHPVPCPIPIQPHSWLEAALFDVSMLNNPIPSVMGGAVMGWCVATTAMVAAGLVFRGGCSQCRGSLSLSHATCGTSTSKCEIWHLCP